LLGGFIVDFYSYVARLAVELDGGQHFETLVADRDQARDEALGQLGVLVLRFDNAAVLAGTREVSEVIWRVWRERVAPPSRAARGRLGGGPTS
jgi:very-short-patch-repair endonuclease